MVPDANGEGDTRYFAACALPGGAATGSFGGTVQRWRWADESSNALTPDGAALQLEDGSIWSLAVAPRPNGELQLLLGCGDGSLKAVCSGGASRALQQQQATLVGHSRRLSVQWL